jgi:O-antigen/teichoic acid export membrane protein
MVPLCAGTVVVAPIIPRVLGWPSDFDNASPLIAILSIQLPIVAVDMVLGVVLMAIGRQGAWVTVGIVATALKIAMDYAAIPVFEHIAGNGAIGASVVTLVTEMVMFVGAMVLIPKRLLDPRIGWDAVRILVAGLATYAAGSTLLVVSPVLGVIGGAAAYVLVAMALRVVSMADLRLISNRVLLRLQPVRFFR